MQTAKIIVQEGGANHGDRIRPGVDGAPGRGRLDRLGARHSSRRAALRHHPRRLPGPRFEGDRVPIPHPCHDCRPLLPRGTPRRIVLSHGYGDNQAQMLPYAEFLHRAGYSVFTYDMRNRGRSGGEAVTLGALEYLDLISAVAYLTTRADVDPDRIGALGLSLGGSTTLLAAASDPRIKAVVDDSGFR